MQNMQNIKSSLNNHQQVKKRQMFWRSQQNFHMPKQFSTQRLSVNQYEQFATNEPNKRISQYAQPNKPKQELMQAEEQIKTVKLTCSKYNNTNQCSNIKYKSLAHPINVTSKIKLSSNCQHKYPAMSESNEQPSYTMMMLQQLTRVKVLFLSNEQRITNIMEFANTLYKNTIQLYNGHQKKLKQIVNARCNEIINIYKSVILTFKVKDQKLNQIDTHINILLNTLKDTKQSLRLIKIKQQCIQMFQKQKYIQNQRQTKKNVGNQRLSKKRQIQKEVINNGSFQPFKSQVNYHDAKIIKQISRQMQHEEPTQSLIDKQSAERVSVKEDYKKSPFQANQMLMTSNATPVIPRKPENQRLDFSEYSFGKKLPVPEFNVEFLPKNVKQIKRMKSLQIPKQQTKNRIKTMQKKLSQILKQFDKKQVWLDNLNCLRFKNGAYVLDIDGNAFICTYDQFSQLVRNKIITENQHQH